MRDIINKIRSKFPALAQQMNGRPLVYIDNAATSQKPVEVLELLDRMNGALNANVHRSMYALSDAVTELYEQARARVVSFINAPSGENVIFTSGTTAAINLVAESYCREFMQEGDAVIVSADSHHSNLVPWQLAAQKFGLQLKILPIELGNGGASPNGQWNMEALESLIDEKVKLIAVSHISNVLGLINPVEELIQTAHSHGIPVLIDGAQGIVHTKVDVQKLDCDFYAFSAHKIYGATGVGILYGKEKWLSQMPPYMGGGDMVGTVTYQKTTYAPLPLKFEAGTPNFIGASSLKPALDWAAQLRGEKGAFKASGNSDMLFADSDNQEIAEAVRFSERAIVTYLSEALVSEIGDVDMYGVPAPEETDKKIPLFSFNIRGCNAGDIAQLLDKMGIAVRSGTMCAEPLLDLYGVKSAVRASFAPYNTIEEARLLIDGLKRAKGMLL